VPVRIQKGSGSAREGGVCTVWTHTSKKLP
jgi:hypothetical protein